MIGRMAIIRLAVFLAFAFIANNCFAANPIEKLMMPGQLTTAHEKFEDDCANCHKVLQKKAQSSLCIDCHKPIKADLAAKKGFHGRNELVAKSECYACHTEHMGRDH
jgi:Class III cytochrome C family